MRLQNGFLTIEAEQLTAADIGHAVGAVPVTELSVVSSRFDRCSFSGLQVESFSAGEGGEPSHYVDCVFDGLHLASLTGIARFERCSFRNIEIDSVRGQALSFVGCTFSGVLRDAQFYARYAAPYTLFHGDTENEFHGNDFSAADFHHVEFHLGIDLSAQRLPTGPDYLYVADQPAALASVRARIAALPDVQARADLMGYLPIFDRSVQQGQMQRLFRKDDYQGRQSGPILELFIQAVAEQ